MFSDKVKKYLTFGLWAGFSILSIWYAFCLPRDLFKGTEWSAVVLDRNGGLLGARIAADGQWRFPPGDSIPEKYRKAVVEFEDRWFRFHPGVNPVSIIRSAVSNLKAGHVVSGGSTLTMQVIRMSRGRERTMCQKFIEAVLATRLELRCSKDEILGMYAAHAPFGGNVVGLEAAAWRYFGRPSGELSWAEAATLAVLPNSPSSIRPGKNRDRLMEKRNRLLARLFEKGCMGRSDYELACSEPLPEEPGKLPSYAPQLVDLLASGKAVAGGKNYRIVTGGDVRKGCAIRTTIEIGIQKSIQDAVDRRSDNLAKEGINDMAAVVMDVRTGEVLAYCGNSSACRKRPGMDVDVARSPRSSGSVLKPFLYCASLQAGKSLPFSLVADTPVNINGFAPQNYNMTYDGAVPTAEALSRSLNVPAVHMLKDFGTEAFKDVLQECGLSTVTRSADDYGLSMILGGAECRLDEVTGVYAEMARRLVYGDGYECAGGSEGFPLTDRVALWYTMEALGEVNRPDEIDWHVIGSVRRTAWKTGTSYGYRDGWACGATPRYAAGVWAGNASGVAAPGLVGARTAGPVLFDIFNSLPGISPADDGRQAEVPEWFPEPLPGEGKTVRTCKLSGFLAGPYCEDTDTITVTVAGAESRSCPYHFCQGGKSFFRLPPAMEWYYRQKHLDYPFSKDDGDDIPEGSGPLPMEFIYPESGAVISIPRQLDGSPDEIVFNLAHHDRSATVYWHIDQDYIGETRFIHQLRFRPSPGKHTVTVVDGLGNTLSAGFTVR
ncbi:MAG: penicillin-binding protein 1C [Candidatus Cryptobacteroides sp.]